MKYEIEGEGEPVVILHGSFGGLKQSKLLGRGLKEEGYQIIAVSRPGYPGTPLEEGPTPGEQADLVAEILDENDIERAHLIGYSAGAEAALAFARKYPERTSNAVLASAIMTDYTAPTDFLDRLFSRQIIYNRAVLELLDYSMRFFARIAPETAFKLASHSRPSNQKELDYFKALLKAFPPLRDKKKGIKNDLEQTRRPPDGIENIRTPVLVINHAEYPEVEETTEYLCDTLQNAHKLILEGGGHLTWIDADIRKKDAILDFLRN